MDFPMKPQNETTNPYALPQSSGGSGADFTLDALAPPAVRFWVQVYNGCMVLLYLGVLAMGIALVVFSDDIAALAEEAPGFQAALMGTVYAVLGLLLAGLFAVGLIWRRGNGAWIYQTVLIVIGLTSCITWPATIPLLIFWIKDRQRLIAQ